MATDRHRRVLIGLSLLSLGLVARSGQAHEQQEQREVVLILGPDRIQLLVGYSLPAGLEAAEVRALVDADGSGLVDRPQEELARATLLGPRMAAGLVVTVNGEPLALALEEMAWQEGPGDPGPRQGFTGLALYAAGWAPAAEGNTEVSLALSAGAAVRAEVQIEPGLQLVDSAVPMDPAVPLIGPVEVLPDLPVRVQVRRATGSE